MINNRKDLVLIGGICCLVAICLTACGGGSEGNEEQMAEDGTPTLLVRSASSLFERQIVSVVEVDGGYVLSGNTYGKEQGEAGYVTPWLARLSFNGDVLWFEEWEPQFKAGDIRLSDEGDLIWQLRSELTGQYTWYSYSLAGGAQGPDVEKQVAAQLNYSISSIDVDEGYSEFFLNRINMTGDIVEAIPLALPSALQRAQCETFAVIAEVDTLLLVTQSVGSWEPNQQECTFYEDSQHRILKYQHNGQIERVLTDYIRGLGFSARILTDGRIQYYAGAEAGAEVGLIDPDTGWLGSSWMQDGARNSSFHPLRDGYWLINVVPETQPRMTVITWDRDLQVVSDTLIEPPILWSEDYFEAYRTDYQFSPVQEAANGELIIVGSPGQGVDLPNMILRTSRDGVMSSEVGILL
jgi:hypothetical protein